MTSETSSLETAPNQQAGTALAPASKQQSQAPAALLLPHESETDFEVLKSELVNELTGPWLGFGRKMANEAVVSRWCITRYRQALLACTWAELAPRRAAKRLSYLAMADAIDNRRSTIEEREELEARAKSWEPPPVPPKLERLEQALEPLLTSETRRYEEVVALLYYLRFAAQRLSEMEQNATGIAIDQNGAAAHSRSKRGISPPSICVDDQNKLTKQARRIMGEPPLVRGESWVEYETAIVDVLTILGNSNASNLFSAVDIINDTWHILRFLELREKALQAAFKATMRRLTGNRPEKEDDIDLERALAITLHENLPMLINYDRIIDRIFHRRKRTIDQATKRNAVRLRTIWVPTSEIKLIR